MDVQAKAAQHPDEPKSGQECARDDATYGDGRGEQEDHVDRRDGHRRRQARGRGREYRGPQPGRLLEEPVQPGITGRWLAQPHHLGGQLSHQRLARRRGPREQNAQGQVGHRELKQEHQRAPGGDDQGRLQRKHQG